MKEKYLHYLLVYILYLLFVSLWRFKLDWGLLFLWLGGVLGSVFLKLDYFFQAFFVNPDSAVGQKAIFLVKEKKYLQSLIFVRLNFGEIKNLLFHTILFQIIFTIFSYFVLTSSASSFGHGLVLTSMLYLLKIQVEELRRDNKLNDYWFNKINVNLDQNGQKLYVGGMILVFTIFSVFLAK